MRVGWMLEGVHSGRESRSMVICLEVWCTVRACSCESRIRLRVGVEMLL